MSRDIDMVDVIHSGSAHPLVVPFESHRLDQVDGDTHAGTETHHGANVAGNFWLEQAKPHGAPIVRRGFTAQAGHFDDNLTFASAR
jgi:hypothetical protein